MALQRRGTLVGDVRRTSSRDATHIDLADWIIEFLKDNNN